MSYSKAETVSVILHKAVAYTLGDMVVEAKIERHGVKLDTLKAKALISNLADAKARKCGRSIGQKDGEHVKQAKDRTSDDRLGNLHAKALFKSRSDVQQ